VDLLLNAGQTVIPADIQSFLCKKTNVL